MKANLYFSWTKIADQIPLCKRTKNTICFGIILKYEVRMQVLTSQQNLRSAYIFKTFQKYFAVAVAGARCRRCGSASGPPPRRRQPQFLLWRWAGVELDCTSVSNLFSPFRTHLARFELVSSVSNSIWGPKT